MKFVTAILLVAFVAIAYAAEEPKEAHKLEPVNEAEAESKDVVRGRRGLAVAAYTAPFAAPVAAVASPFAAAYTAPVAAVAAPVAAPVAYAAPYASHSYSSFVRHHYAPYYSYPAVYV